MRTGAEAASHTESDALGVTMRQVKKKATERRSRNPLPVIGALKPVEAAKLLRTLLAHHPELTAEATAIAEAMIVHVVANDIADSVEEAILRLDIDALGTRAGAHGDKYTESSQAAWELLEEALAPFVDNLRRQIAFGAEAAAIETCRGIVVGLYRVRGKNSDAVLGWAEDFPLEAASQTLSILRAAGRASRRWSLPKEVEQEVPAWASSLARWQRKG